VLNQSFSSPSFTIDLFFISFFIHSFICHFTPPLPPPSFLSSFPSSVTFISTGDHQDTKQHQTTPRYLTVPKGSPTSPSPFFLFFSASELPRASLSHRIPSHHERHCCTSFLHGSPIFSPDRLVTQSCIPFPFLSSCMLVGLHCDIWVARLKMPSYFRSCIFFPDKVSFFFPT